jgi:hypothetical protein
MFVYHEDIIDQGRGKLVKVREPTLENFEL